MNADSDCAAPLGLLASAGLEQDWSSAADEAARAWHCYALLNGQTLADEPGLDRLMLRLGRVERRRDEFLKSLE